MVDTDQVFSLEHFLMIKLYKLLKNPVPVVMETLTFHLGLTSPYSCYCFSSICSFDYTIRAVNTNCSDIPHLTFRLLLASVDVK